MTILKGNDLLTTTQCNALRGIAIIAIFLHNFCHWLVPSAIWENEYNFNLPFSRKMWHYLTDGGIDIYLPIQLFSFFGHYGVAIFLFLSGFGLVMKYERSNSPNATTLSFLIFHWQKLFRLMFLGLIVSLFIHTAYNILYHDNGFVHFIAELLFVNNVLPNPDFNTIPGPYWFFGLIMEVYVIYRLVVYPTRATNTPNKKWLRWFIPVMLALVAIAIQVPLIKRTVLLRYLRYNAVVAMLPFSSGVLIARYGFPKLHKWTLATIAVASAILLMLVNMNYYTWLWGHLLVVAGSISFVKLFEARTPRIKAQLNASLKPFVWTGALSSCIYVVHVITRMPIFMEVLKKSEQNFTPSIYLWILLYIIITLLLALAYKYYLNICPKPVLKIKQQPSDRAAA